MKNSIGTSIILTVFGESHGPAVGAIVDGLAPGIEINYEEIDKMLLRRRPNGLTDTSRVEIDEYQFLSGVYNGKTTGTPLCVIIPNKDIKGADYDSWRGLARPNHADYSGYMKYHGFEDYHGSGHFSGRVTAGIVVIGAILKTALKKKGILIGSHILKCGKVEDIHFEGKNEEIESLENKFIPTLNNIEKDIEKEILKAKEANDSIGGLIETMVIGHPAGVGEPWFDSVESLISQAMFAVGGVKGIEFGDGFKMANAHGSEVSDNFNIKNGKIVTKTNHSGGINGGITNGMPIIFTVAIKPTSSIGKEMETVDFIKNEEATLKLVGRHDPSIVRRVNVVIEAMTAIVMADLLAQRYGTDYLRG